jgi:hypothetical protein
MKNKNSAAAVSSLTTTVRSVKKRKVGRPSKSDNNLAQWTIRGVDKATRRLFVEAKTKSGKTSGQYFNEDLKEFLRCSLNPQPVNTVTIIEVEALINKAIEKFKSDLIQELDNTNNSPAIHGNIIQKLFRSITLQ